MVLIVSLIASIAFAGVIIYLVKDWKANTTEEERKKKGPLVVGSHPGSMLPLLKKYPESIGDELQKEEE